MTQNKILYVLGAGFSKKAKCPLMPEFTDKDSFKWLKKRLNKKDKTRLEFLENYVLDRMALGYCHNIEEFLNHVSIGDFLWMESMTEYKRETYSGGKIFRDLQWYIVKLIQEKTMKKIPKLYEKFLARVLEEEATIISFNYDMIVENVFNKLNKHYSYFPEQRDANHPLILKLHGSGNWSYCNDCNQPKITHQSYVADRILSRKFKCEHCRSVNLEPIIVPPMLNKDYQNPGQGGDFFRFLWNDATNELLAAEKEHDIRKKAIERGRTQVLNLIQQSIYQQLSKLRYDPYDIKPILHPIDFAVFNGMNKNKMEDVVLLSRKTKNPILKNHQIAVAKAVKSRSYDWKVVRVSRDGQIEFE